MTYTHFKVKLLFLWGRLDVTFDAIKKAYLIGTPFSIEGLENKTA